MSDLLRIDPSAEKNIITMFIKKTLQNTGFQKVVIGLSGGIDSATAFYLLKEAIEPENIFVAHLYYQNSQLQDIEAFVKKAGIPKSNIYEMSIDPLVKSFQNVIPDLIGNLDPRFREDDKVRLGNIMARIRMTILYDLAKKHNAMVCGTENKSEFLLGYFTRFGDGASDFEPIQHLYKTQVYKLANYLNVPKNIIDKMPTAGLWPGQTDELEYGFTYKEADQVLFYYYDKKLKIEEIKSMGFKNANKVIDFALKNSYKHHVPYTIK